jgi:hypothetical protein
MSQENVESFKRGIEAWNRDDYDAWIDEFDPELQWFALMEVFRGHAALRDGKAVLPAKRFDTEGEAEELRPAVS